MKSKNTRLRRTSAPTSRRTPKDGDTPNAPAAASAAQPPTDTTGSASPSPSASADAAPLQLPIPIVGIGASAGGLEAFTAFLKHLPPDTGLAFVLIQHMDPKHESMLHRLLAKHTAMPVAQVEDGMQVEPNHVYVTPADAELTIHGGVLRLAARSAGVQRYTPIDTFFSALARDHKDKSIGIVLSGIGSDGTKGLEAIREEGGITFAQDEASARYPGMPMHALAAGCVDLALPPDQLAVHLAGLIHHPYLSAAPPQPIEQQLPAEEVFMRRIFRALRSATGVDFSGYKQATIRRRIARRMVVRHCDTLPQYAKTSRSIRTKPLPCFRTH